MITSPVALKAVQNEIAFAYENVGFFRKHMEKAGLTPKDVVSAEAITKIPPTTKADYRRNFPLNVLAKGRSLNDPGLIKLQSAGTESDRLVTVVGSLTLASRMATCVRMNAGFKFLLSPGLGRPRTARYAAPNCSDVECSNPNSTMADRMMWGG